MRALMDEDSERFRKALAKTGNKVSVSEPIMNATLRYEADVDLPTLAAEIGLKPEELLPRLTSPILAKSFGALKVPGRHGPAAGGGAGVRRSGARLAHRRGVSSRVRRARRLRDNTGEVDPLEAQSSPANAAAFSPDGLFAAFASADKTVVIWDVDAGREKRRCIGHTASVWCVAFSPDGSRLLSGGKDGTVRLWETRTARELHTFEGHDDLVTCVAFSPDGRRALSAGYDNKVILWDLEQSEAAPDFAFDAPVKYINAVAFSPDGERCLVCADEQGLRRRRGDGKGIADLQRTYGFGGGGGVLAGRQARPFRRRRPDNAAMGRGRRRSKSRSFQDMRAGSRAWLSARTASTFSPDRPTRRCAGGT